MKKFFAVLTVAFAILAGSPSLAQAAPTSQGLVPISATSSVESEVLSIKQVNAMRNAACPNNKVCFYECPLSAGCTYSYSVSSTDTACKNVWAQSIGVFSVKNTTGYRFKVYHSSNCGTVGSYFYAETSADMNWEWVADGIGSIKRG